MGTEFKVDDYVAQERAIIGREITSLVGFREALADGASVPVTEGENRAEMLANVSIAIRHLEDAKMRLGKFWEARDGSNATR